MPSKASTRYKGGTEYKPTEIDRAMVTRMVGVGIPQDDICAVLDITAPTLHRHFRRELDTAYVKVLTRMRARLIKKADAGDTKALIFYNQTHGWSARVTVVDGGVEAVNPGTLSDSELESRIARLAGKARPMDD